jgi:hypothetical protein
MERANKKPKSFPKSCMILLRARPPEDVGVMELVSEGGEGRCWQILDPKSVVVHSRNTY